MRILDIATSLPKNEYSTKKLIEIFPCKLPEGVRKNILNLGVASRYLVNSGDTEDTMSEAPLIDLCTDACQKAIEQCDLQPKDIGYFVATYDVNPLLSPGLSQLLIRNIGFDSYVKHVNLQGIASTAFPKALELAENYLAAHKKDYVLLCISGVSSYWFQNQVRGMKEVMEIDQINKMKNEVERLEELRKWIATMQFFLFGDGVAAAVVANEGRGLSVEKIVEVTNLRKEDYLAGHTRLIGQNEPFRFGFYSNLGREIPELGTKYTTLALKRLLGEKMEAIVKAAKKWAVHTGSKKILNRIAERHKIPYERIKESHEILRDYGNLAGASLPFIFKEIVSNGKLQRDDMILMVGYGWGFSAAASLLEYT